MKFEKSQESILHFSIFFFVFFFFFFFSFDTTVIYALNQFLFWDKYQLRMYFINTQRNQPSTCAGPPNKNKSVPLFFSNFKIIRLYYLDHVQYQDIIVEIRILINFQRNLYLPHKILSTTSYVFSSTFEWWKSCTCISILSLSLFFVKPNSFVIYC